MAGGREGFIRRSWRRLRSPSTHWSVLTLVVIGILAGFGATVGTQVMVYVTGTDKFCGTSCHSMQWVAKEHQASSHTANRTGVHAGCHDCHVPRDYPELLWYKAMAGTKDIIGEMRGVMDTEAKFKAKRKELAEHVWAEYKANDSRACRGCHKFSKEVIAKQKDFVQPIHTQVLQGQGTCIDCHQGITHTPPG